MQRIPIVENVVCHTHKQFHLSHVTVADPDSSDSSRLHPNERYWSLKLNTHKFLLSAPKEVFTSINFAKAEYITKDCDELHITGIKMS